MAEAPDVMEKTLEELEREISCAVCHGEYQQAKLLPCNHYYCAACIEDLAKHARGQPFDCPECRKTTSLPPGGVAELDGAFFIERMKDFYGKMAKAEGRVEAVCEECAGGKSVAFCRQCTAFICEDCARSHSKMKVFTGHKVSTLADLKRGEAKDVFLKEAPLSTCPEHEEQMKIFCYDCDRLVCRDCVLYDHREHKSDFLKKCASESRKTLHESLGPLREVRATFASAEKDILAAKNAVAAQNKEVCGFIQQYFYKLKTSVKATLDQRNTELVRQANRLAQDKEDALAAQVKGLEMGRTEIQSLVEFVERNVESTSDQDLMSIRTQLQTKMKEGEKNHQKTSLQPTATADVVCTFPPFEIPTDLGAIFTRSISAVKVNLQGEANVGEPTQFRLEIPESIGCKVRVQLKSLVDPGCIVEASVANADGYGTFAITFTPRVRGRHDLIVKVNGADVKGSPFPVFVKIHPRQLGEPVRVIDDFSMPWGIAINDKQQLVVTEVGERKVTIMEQDGNTAGDIMLKSPTGVAIGPDNTIYVADQDAQCLFNYSNDGKLLFQSEKCLYRPLFANVVDGQVYVSDINMGEIVIFDAECKKVGTIESEYPHPKDIAEYDGELYLASDGNRRIDVYQCCSGGKCIRHVDIKQCKLNRGLCFDRSGYLYVVFYESGSEGVYVYSRDGEFITSFGLGFLFFPAGIAIDEDGFINVCDHIENGKIYVF